MIEIVDRSDRSAVRNMNNIVSLHEVMINQRRPEAAVAMFLDPGYVQHDPLLGTGAESTTVRGRVISHETRDHEAVTTFALVGDAAIAGRLLGS